MIGAKFSVARGVDHVVRRPVVTLILGAHGLLPAVVEGLLRGPPFVDTGDDREERARELVVGRSAFDRRCRRHVEREDLGEEVARTDHHVLRLHVVRLGDGLDDLYRGADCPTDASRLLVEELRFVHRLRKVGKGEVERRGVGLVLAVSLGAMNTPALVEHLVLDDVGERLTHTAEGRLVADGEGLEDRPKGHLPDTVILLR